MIRLAVLAAAFFAAGAAQSERLDVDPGRFSSFMKPISVQPGTLIAGEISDVDYVVGPDWNAEVFTFDLAAGQVVTAQLRTDIATAEVFIRSARSHTGKALLEGPARETPLRFVAPKAGAYVLAVHAKGPQRRGKYLLSFGTGDAAPAFDPPPVQVAQVPTPVPAAAPLTPPPLPVIPGVINIRDGQTLSRPGGKPGAGAELFQFLAPRGAKLGAVVTGAGPIVVTVYGPDGKPLATADGMAILRLDAILPRDGVYFLSVALSDSTKPYKLALSTPD